MYEKTELLNNYDISNVSLTDSKRLEIYQLILEGAHPQSFLNKNKRFLVRDSEFNLLKFLLEDLHLDINVESLNPFDNPLLSGLSMLDDSVVIKHPLNRALEEMFFTSTSTNFIRKREYAYKVHTLIKKYISLPLQGLETYDQVKKAFTKANNDLYIEIKRRIDEALQRAQAHNKPLLIFFRSRWGYYECQKSP